MTADLVLPDPATTPVAQVRSEIPAYAAAMRAQIAVRGDIAGARELCRRLEAFRRYLQDRIGRDLLAVECRRTEMLIGQLLGPPRPGERTDLNPALVSAGSGVPHSDAVKFRLLAEHEQLVEQLLTEGVRSRDTLVAKIRRRLEPAADIPEVRQGDFRDVLADLPDGCASLVLTDPPYERAAYGLYSDLGKEAARLLRPGGSLICYVGQSTLPEALPRLGEHLRYWWTLALTHAAGGQQLPGKWVIVEWKPVLWFVNGHRDGREYVADRLRGTAPEKDHHGWAQGIGEVQYLVERLTEPGELVVDPSAGAASFGRAVLPLGRRYIGADTHEGGSTGVTA